MKPKSKLTMHKHKSFLFAFPLLFLSIVTALSVCNHYQSFLILCPAIAIAIYILLRQRNNIELFHYQPYTYNRIHPLWYFIIIFGFSIFWWLAYYPGDFNLDAYGQWDQAHGIAPFSDWHPLTSTLWIKAIIFFYDSMPFYIFIQIILFSTVCSCLLHVLQKYTLSAKGCLVLAFYIGFNPAIGLNTIAVTKDAQFTIIAILYFVCLLKIYYSEGNAIKKYSFIICFSIVSAFLVLLRHNGLLLVLPAYIFLFLLYRPYIRWIMISLICSILIVFLIKMPISQKLHVSPHDNPLGEAVGIPMGIMANAFVHEPDKLPDDVQSFMLSIATEEEWQKHYITGEWDSCKWVFGGIGLLQNESPAKILSLTYKTIITCPQYSYESFRMNTRIVWNPLITDNSWVPETFVSTNDYGISNHPIPFFANIARLIISFSLLPCISCLFWNTGFVLALLFLFICLYRRISDIRLVLLFLPFVCLWLGTMLLLSGPNYRYFYSSAIIGFPLISIVSFSQKKRSN